MVGEDLCPTHATLNFLVDLQGAKFSTYSARKVKSLGTLVSDAFQL